MKAILKTYRQSPRKVRLVADMIRGKKVPYALTVLEFLDRRAAGPLRKLLTSAVANARVNNNISREEDLVIKKVSVDKGVTLKRSRPRARGRASRINKRTSHILIELATR